jgi:hypothetical protein
MKKPLIPLLGGLLALVLLPPDVLVAQTEEVRRAVPAYRLSGSEVIHFDGRVEEAFWSMVEPATGFRMQEPREGAEASESTEVRIAYDSRNLYIGAILYDSDPSQIKAFMKRRDLPMFSDERFTWILDTFNDQRSAYLLEVNPNGMRTDGLVQTGQGTSINLNWDGVWDARTVIGDFGWSAEIKIPFRTLNFDPASETWGANFMRVIRRKNETVLWTGYRRNQGISRPQDAGALTGLAGLSQGLGLEIVPYGILGRSEDRLTDGSEISVSPDVGLDLNYSITPSLKASLTINTDFAETEVDERQINLTRFPLFFPEQRDFFLEGSGIYEFAPASRVNPFFSRRIGLDEETGEPIPITFGGRLLGNSGNYNIAFLHVRTAKTENVNREDVTMARVRRNIGDESTIGVIYTRRSSQEGDQLDPALQDRHTVGVDLELGTSRFAGDKNLQFQAFFVYHNTPFPGDDSTDIWDRSTRGLRFNFPNQPWSAHVSYREFGRAYDPAVGFAPRNSFRRLNPRIGYAPQFEDSDLIQQIGWSVWFEHLTDLEFTLMTQELRFGLFDVRFMSGDDLALVVSRGFERLVEPFDIKGDGSIIIPVGDFTNWQVAGGLWTAPFRKASAEVGIETGGFWSGRRSEFRLRVTLRPLAGFEMAPEYIHTDVDLEEGDFSTDLFRFQGTLDPTTFLLLSATVQYDNLSDLLGMNTRLRWIITPGSDLYLVYNHNWLRQDSRFTTRQRTGTIKVSYTHRF